MPESDENLRLEIRHVLFIDIVGYSKLLIEEQKERVGQLTEIVLQTAQVREATDEQLVRLPTGDGMALVFRHSPEEPARCALEIAEALRKHPELPVRMGIHSGPVSEVSDVSGRTNITGAGINMAQRVMDCGDAGHILLSQHVADDLMQYRQWAPRLRDLGECEVKHGVRLHLVNLYSEPLGNPEPPEKFRQIVAATPLPPPLVKPKRMPWHEIVIALLLVAAVIAAAFFYFRKNAPPPSASATAAPEKSIAVLPFDNLSRDPDNAFFADGMQDEVLTNLAKIADLKVISRTSVMQYKTGAQRNLREIAQQLGVAHVVEGSVQRAANKVRVNAQLIDARTDAHLWGQVYDRDLADVFAIQSEIAKAIAEQLHAKLSPSEKSAIEQRPTADLIAFDQYTRAKTLLLTSGYSVLARKDSLQAIDLLNSAVARDPSFYSAYCQLVVAHDSVYAVQSDRTASRLAAAEAALQTATQLQPDSPETHLAHAWHLYYAVRDYKGAMAKLEVARRGLANDPRIFELTGYILRRQGKHEEGLSALERAVALDPRNTFTLTQIALSYGFLRRYAKEAHMLDRAVEIAPDDVALASSRAFLDLKWQANPEPLHRYIEQLRLQRPSSLGEVADNWIVCALAERDWTSAEQALAALIDGLFWGDGSVRLPPHFGQGLLARAMQDETRARTAFTAARLEQEKLVQEQMQFGPALCVLGLIDAALGNKELALQEGRRALELLPVEKDATNHQRLVAYFALIAAWAGEKDLALEQLKAAIPLPGASYITSYGVLKLLPFWDPLRGDPRFEAIVASLAPKE